MANATPSVLAGLAGRVTIDFTKPLPSVAAPLRAFPARTATGDALMAVQVERGQPARARVLGSLADAQIDNVLLPVMHGSAALPSNETGYFVICPMPPGPALSVPQAPWPDAMLLNCLIRPVATALVSLQAARVTHRAIRLSNLFQPGPGQPVTLGCAWAAPPASHQPDASEPPYVAVCLTAGRGDGCSADDVYALGVALVTLALGFDPVAELDGDTVVRRKLDMGSYAALVGQHRLSPAIAELARGMLADDPDHRPSPALLRDPVTARARRIATLPPRRATRPLQIGPFEAANLRMTALGALRHPEQALAVFVGGGFDTWLRRGLGETAMASKVDDLRHIRGLVQSSEPGRGDASFVAGVVAVLDPLAPLTWRGLALWPDGLGPALDHAQHHAASEAALLTEIVAAEIVPVWAIRRPDRIDVALTKLDTRQQRQWLTVPQVQDGSLRLKYALNPLTPCASPMLKSAWVVRIAELLPALEQAAPNWQGKAPPLDGDILAFIAGRQDERIDAELPRLAQLAIGLDGIPQLAVLARLQDRLRTGPLPRLAAWAAVALRPVIDQFSSASRRQRLHADLAQLADAGLLLPIQTLITNGLELESDRDGRASAQDRLHAIDAALTRLAEADGAGGEAGRRIGSNVAMTIGTLAMAAAVTFALFS